MTNRTVALLCACNDVCVFISIVGKSETKLVVVTVSGVAFAMCSVVHAEVTVGDEVLAMMDDSTVSGGTDSATQRIASNGSDGSTTIDGGTITVIGRMTGVDAGTGKISGTGILWPVVPAVPTI